MASVFSRNGCQRTPGNKWVGSGEAPARAVGQELIVLKAGTEDDIDTVFTALVQRRADALLVAASPLFVTRAN